MNIKDFECLRSISHKTENLDLLYCLFVSQENGGDIFSLCVSVYENGVLTDEGCVFDISRSKREAENIFDLISSHCVTPYSLDECLDAVYDIVSLTQ